jgi:hypothetical protein
VLRAGGLGLRGGGLALGVGIRGRHGE